MVVLEFFCRHKTCLIMFGTLCFFLKEIDHVAWENAVLLFYLIFYPDPFKIITLGDLYIG